MNAAASRRQCVYLDMAVRGVWEGQAAIWHKGQQEGFLNLDFVADPLQLRPGDLLVTGRPEHWPDTPATVVDPHYICWLLGRAKGHPRDVEREYDPLIDNHFGKEEAKRKAELSAAAASHAAAQQAYDQARDALKKAAARLAKATKAVEKDELPKTAITHRHVRRRLAPGELWRAQDFWRAALTIDAKKNIYKYVNKELDNYRALQHINQARQARALPAFFFIDVSNWLWSIKEDGYLVKLTRDGTGKWSMFTRTDKELQPPTHFLHGLESNKDLPSLMVGELLTDFNGCAHEDKGDVGRRTVLRNEQFKILNKIFRGGPDAWYGLRVKLFAFPDSTMTMRDTYDHYSTSLTRTFHRHTHIGMCRFHTLQSTGHAIDIFNSVVQNGLEGIVIVKADVPYGTLVDSKDAEAQYIFKLKQKIVERGHMIKQGKQILVLKDGIDVPEYEYTVYSYDGTCIKFTDAQNRPTGSWSRLKYMEFAPGMGNAFPCQSGFRHLHFATDYDVTVEPPPVVAEPEVSVARCCDLFNPEPFARKPRPRIRKEN